MRCPNCKSAALATLNTGNPERGGLLIPKEFVGENIIRRRRRCMGCKLVFYSIEQTEDEYIAARQRRYTTPDTQVRRTLP